MEAARPSSPTVNTSIATTISRIVTPDSELVFLRDGMRPDFLFSIFTCTGVIPPDLNSPGSAENGDGGGRLGGNLVVVEEERAIGWVAVSVDYGAVGLKSYVNLIGTQRSQSGRIAQGR